MRLVCTAAALLVSGFALAAPLYRGMSYTSWSKDAFSSSGSDQSILAMKADGVDAVALNFWWFQDNETSTVITEDFSRYCASEPSVRHAIQFIRANGMRVLLKPNIDLRNGKWRGEIVPSAAWFAAYTTFITHWATIAQQEGAESLSIGCEYVKTDSWATQWRQVAAAVRAVYGGRLTYSANHGNEDKVNWWDAVDFIGIDAYYKLTSKNDPTLAELKTAWSSRRNSIRNWRNSKWPNKQIAFTEIGYRSANGTNQAPWDYSSSWALDLQEQADCYEALFSTMWSEPWWEGAFMWNWETNPNAGGLSDKGYTPQGKPAEQTLRGYYLQPKETTLTGTVTLGDFVGDVASEIATIELRTVGSTTPVESKLVALSADGAFTYTTLQRGTFDLGIKGRTWLRKVLPSVVITDAGVTGLSAMLTNGDSDGDNAVTVFDYSILSEAFDATPTDDHWNVAADLDGDGMVTVFDYIVLSNSFDAVGDA